VRAALEYAGVVSALLSAAKEHGRTDVLSVLAVPLGEVLRELLGELLIESPPAVEERDRAGRVLLVTMPSAARARRVRGYRPVDVLVRRAGFRVSRRPGLLLAREVADQAGLSASGRRHNLQGSMRASPAVGGRRVLLVDDVVTTGSTLLEAARAVRSMGGSVTGAACLAHTARRIGAHDEASGRTQ
jgi:predicted amidophosphoribosyltransferase